METEQATESECVPQTAREMMELVMEIPRLTYEMIEMTGATPVKLFAFLPDDEQEKYIQLLYGEYPGFAREYWGEFYGLPLHAFMTGMATTLLRWLGDEDGYWEDVEKSKTLPFFHWLRWLVALKRYDREEIKTVLEGVWGKELKAIAVSLS